MLAGNAPAVGDPHTEQLPVELVVRSTTASPPD
jgi:hypothetical protein